jgi:hypothetical protein
MDDKKRSRSDTDADETLREGEVLGLGGSAVPKSPSDPVTEFDAESVARRRARATGGDDVSSPSGLPRSSGATGIDMGSGGSGTDVE